MTFESESCLCTHSVMHLIHFDTESKSSDGLCMRQRGLNLCQPSANHTAAIAADAGLKGLSTNQNEYNEACVNKTALRLFWEGTLPPR